MRKTAQIRQQIFALLLGCVLGYLLSRRRHAVTIDEIAQYRQVARDARRNADSLKATEAWRTP